MNERGYYTTDTLRLVIAVADINRLLPAMITDPALHIKDRVVFHDTVFVPTRVLPRGLYKERYSVVTIDCNQVNAEELVNDPQFQSTPYQIAATVNTNNNYGYDGYGTGEYGS
jgi:hypothetical protein